MMDAIIMKLRRSRETQPIFGDRVTGVADESRVLEERVALAFPCAYVHFQDEEAEGQQPSNAYQQRVAQRWGIIVGLDARNDIRGHDPVRQIELIRPRLFKAIYNWRPAKGYGAIWYDGCNLRYVGRDASFYQFMFGTHYTVCEDDGETEEQFDPLPVFAGADFHIDAIDPRDPGLPPSQIYDPRRGPPPWATGPEGRIEWRTRVNIDTGPAPHGRLRRWLRWWT